MTITEKAARLKGLIEGMEYDVNTKEGKLFAAIIDLLEDLSLSVSDLEDETAALRDYIEEIDEDLGDVERDIYETDDSCCDDDECDDDECVELTCPACGKKICIDCEDIEDADTIECPSCKKLLNVIKEDEEDESEEEPQG